MHEKAVYYQTQVSDDLRREIVEIQREIDKEEAGREDALAQAKTGDKAELARALHRTLESLQQAISLLISFDCYGVDRTCEDRTRETHDERTVCFFVSGEARQGARPLRRDQERRDGAARPREGEARPLCPTLSPRGPTRLSRAAAVRSAGSIGPLARSRRAREAREARAQEVDREPAQARRRGVGALAAPQRDGDRAH